MLFELPIGTVCQQLLMQFCHDHFHHTLAPLFRVRMSTVLFQIMWEVQAGSLREPIPLLSARHLRNSLTASLRPCLAARMNQSTALQLLSSSSSSSANLKKCFPTYNKQETKFLQLLKYTLLCRYVSLSSSFSPPGTQLR